MQLFSTWYSTSIQKLTCNAVVIAALLAGTMLAGTTLAATPAQDAPAIDMSDALAKLRLTYGELQTIPLPSDPNGEVEFSIDLGGEVFDIVLVPHYMQSPRYRLLVDHGDGVLQEINSSPPMLFRGELDGGLGTIAASVNDKGLTGTIHLYGERWHIQPLRDAIPGSDTEAHVVYKDEDLIQENYECGTDHSIRAQIEDLYENDPDGTSAAGGTFVQVAELAFETDFEFFSLLGSAEAVEDDIFNIMNAVELQHDDQVGIRYDITTILIRDNVNDPYSNATAAGQLVSEFQARWSNPGFPEFDIPRDLAHMFTGRNLDSPVLGIALLGTVCLENSAFSLAQTRFTSNFAVRVDLSSHEIGHLWNAPHCDVPGPGFFSQCCIPPNYTMCSSLGSNVRGIFSPPIVDVILAFKASRFCLSDVAQTATLPFFDDFSTGLDDDMWVNQGTLVDGFGNIEPSPPFSLHFNFDDRVNTGVIDTIGVCGLTAEYWWQRSGTLGTGGSPEPGEDLIVEYRSSSGSWVEAARHPGSGNDFAPFVFNSVVFGPDASHGAFQVRMRFLGNSANDNFFVDDFSISAISDNVAIAEQPSPDFACANGTGMLTVEPEGDGDFTYQWRKNEVDLVDGGNISGATSATLTVSPVGDDDLGNYTVVVSNECSSVESIEAMLSQVFDVEISVQPAGGEINLGDPFFAFIQASEQPSFQWFRNGQPLEGQTELFLSIAEVGCDDAGTYFCRLTNDCGTIDSDMFDVTIVDGDEVCVDTNAPRILHQEGLVGQTHPFSGYIDSRRESDNAVDHNLGTTQVQILFSEEVSALDGGGLTDGSFVITETGGGDPPTITTIDQSQMPLVTITFDRPLTLREWTTIRALVQDTAPIPNVIIDNGNLGDDDEEDRVDIGVLPADTDQNGRVQPLDLLRMRQALSGTAPDPDQGVLEDFFDIDRNGSIQALDLLRWRQLWAGSGGSTQAWEGAQLNNDRP